jgi:hypothetical protein
MVPRYIFTKGLNALGQIVMKHANGPVLNVDLCDLQKVGQINPGIMSCILIRCT